MKDSSQGRRQAHSRRATCTSPEVYVEAECNAEMVKIYSECGGIVDKIKNMENRLGLGDGRKSRWREVEGRLIRARRVPNHAMEAWSVIIPEDEYLGPVIRLSYCRYMLIVVPASDAHYLLSRL